MSILIGLICFGAIIYICYCGIDKLFNLDSADDVINRIERRCFNENPTNLDRSLMNFYGTFWEPKNYCCNCVAFKSGSEEEPCKSCAGDNRNWIVNPEHKEYLKSSKGN